METKQAIQTAEYVRAQLTELARLSRDSGFDILAYLIEVAALEADTLCHGQK